jgi:predicted RNA methylase
LGSKTLRRASLELLTASFVVLFQELTIIRWLPGQVRVLAYFPNLILLSAFLGLGLGCLRAGRRSLLWAWPLSLLLVACTALAMSRIIFTQSSGGEHLWLLYYDLGADAPVVPDVRLPIVASFVVSVLAFVPLGQYVAERLNLFRAGSSALLGYSWDILGSLLGVLGFALCSFARSPPVLWFGVFLAAGFVLMAPHRRLLVLYAAAGAGTLAISVVADRADHYSPYYAIAVERNPGQSSFALLTNGSVHQYGLDLRRGGAVETPEQRLTRDGYHLPYRILGRPPGRALVLGAGTGNDVAVLLDEGANEVDAVEIDPGILSVGRELHPDRPYASPRVKAFATDARSFLNRTRTRYDLIVFGTLDSMTRLSALSNVRLDNFVYTRECLRAAREHLDSRGGVVMYFLVASDYIDGRLTGLVAEVFGEVPLIVRADYGLFNRILMAGPAFSHEKGEERRAAAPELLRRVTSLTEIPTDDWPYLYLRRRGISAFYLTLIGVLGSLAALSVSLASPAMRSSLRSGGSIDLEMFLFGLAFLLLETKAVTEMNLVWGATWLTSAIVFASILATILTATIATQLRPIPWRASAAALVLALLAVYAFPVELLLDFGPAGRLALSVAYVGVPIFFAATTFALLFREREDSAASFGWNVLGAVAGGLLEFLSMAIGLRALFLVALVAYLAAFLVRLRTLATRGR